MSFDEFSDPEIKDREEKRAHKRQIIRQQLLRRKLSELPDYRQLRDFRSFVHNYADSFGPEQEIVLTYLNFQKVRELVPEPLKSLLTAELFSHDKNAADGVALCEVGSLFDIVDTRLTMTRYFYLLSLYDTDGDGFLTALEFYQFYNENVAVHFPELANVKEQYQEDSIVAIVVAKFQLFLDRGKCDRVWIRDILSSGIISEVNALCDGSSRYEFGNWFCPENITYVLEEYAQYMSDDGFIKREDFLKYQLGVKNRLFLGKIFDFLTCSSDGCMDVVLFSKFQLILRYKSNPVSLKVIFEGLDIHYEGVLTRRVLEEHFNELYCLADCRGDLDEYPIDFPNWVCEVFDMLSLEKGKTHITLEDWLNGPCVHYVVLKLLDSVALVALEREEDRKAFLSFDSDTNVVKVRCDDNADSIEQYFGEIDELDIPAPQAE
ncbi:hypothetical protein QR680_019222 [Steinernema hermaphroditum]|uniref:EF-hand domain-containing protein n=1 Tax=Steinernema hermaphroditum TaxID=289476 RepID=A0AA39LS25_9BILA|nr:hypothetical protein QR680_019222 [Steinernema hermaphroditum]